MTEYTFDITKYPKQKKTPTTPNLINGIYISLDADDCEPILDKIGSWFANRDEVVIIDHGTSDKQGLGFILLEWIECEIDPIFLQILENDEDIDDYTTYASELEAN